jgi:hypothetical protein
VKLVIEAMSVQNRVAFPPTFFAHVRLKTAIAKAPVIPDGRSKSGAMIPTIEIARINAPIKYFTAVFAFFISLSFGSA